MKITSDEEQRRVEEVVAKFAEVDIRTIKEFWQALVSEEAKLMRVARGLSKKREAERQKKRQKHPTLEEYILSRIGVGLNG